MGQRVLFIGLDETELALYRELARLLAATGRETRVVTLLPRLAGHGVEALIEDVGAWVRDSRQLRGVVEHQVRSAGQPATGYAAHYDRDWYRASWRAKRSHVLRVGAAWNRLLDRFTPSVTVSAVGGETSRVVGEAVARARGVPTVYFNGLPMPSRFVILDRLDAPFVPRDDQHRGATPRWDGLPEALPLTGIAGSSGIVREGLQRILQHTGPDRYAYPSGWLPRKLVGTARRRVLVRVPSGSLRTSSGEFTLLYPLHDERDFQVAVRERHALPQSAFLRYVASILPPGVRLLIKPHPQHAVDHHELLWQDVVRLPNVSLLPNGVTVLEAVALSNAVLTLASTLGFEALTTGTPVICYGRPFYSGRGLTIDVDDIRAIGTAVERSRSFCVDHELLNGLYSMMLMHSYRGSFNPLVVSAENVGHLAAGLLGKLEELEGST